MSKSRTLPRGYERRLDVLIAVHVFGWKWFHVTHFGRDFYIPRPPASMKYIRWNFFEGIGEALGEVEVKEPDWSKICSDFYNGGGIRSDNIRRPGPFDGKLPPFSSNWEAARLLAERLGRHGQVRHYVAFNYEPTTKDWRVTLAGVDKEGLVRFDNNGNGMRVEVIHKEMPMALVLATLRLKGIKINDWVLAGHEEKN